MTRRTSRQALLQDFQDRAASWCAAFLIPIPSY